MDPALRSLIDEPIRSSKEDLLDRARPAANYARHLRALNSSRGLVAAVMGKWGHGKSSFVNLMREELEQAPRSLVVDFNPWMFSGSESLTDIFFREIAAELRVKSPSDRVKAVADELDGYASVLAPVAGAVVPVWGTVAAGSVRALLKGGSKLLELRKRGARQIHERVAEALRQLDQPVVVVVDDIDRLSTEEIRDVFRLVRVTGSFPNLIYVLAFDRGRVEAALNDTSIDGRSYLSKIVQVGIDLPVAPDAVMNAAIFAELNRVLESVPEERFDVERWPDVFGEVVRPLISSMRDVTRYAMAVQGAAGQLSDEIDFVDLLALEAVRTFEPDVFGAIASSVGALTDVGGDRERSEERAEVDGLVGAARDPKWATRLVRRVFPAARRFTENHSYGSSSVSEWLAAHRVAHIDWLTLYLNRSETEALGAFRQAEKFVRVPPDRHEMRAALDALPPGELEGVIDSLHSVIPVLEQESIVPLAGALLNRVEAIPVRERRSMFDINRPDIVVSRAVLALLRRPEVEDQIEDVVERILGQVETLSGQFELTRIVGHGEGQGHKLVSEKFAADLEDHLCKRVHRKEPLLPEREWNALRVYYFVGERLGMPSAPEPLSPQLTAALLASARSERASQSMDSRFVRTEPNLAWDALVEVVGGEEILREALARTKRLLGSSDELVLAEKYVAGWRPSEWLDR